MPHSLLLLVAVQLTGPATAPLPCEDPLILSSGVPIAETLDVAITYTDGYQTLADLRYPITPAPQCGWPLIVFVHGGGGAGKAGPTLAAERMSGLGYATLAFDLRGEGVSFALNDPLLYGSTYQRLRERIDLFEVIEFASSNWPGLVDPNRIGVRGSSLGAQYAWIAAAHSGRSPPQNPWRTAPFSKITCAMVHAWDSDFAYSLAPGGLTANASLMPIAFLPTTGVAPGEQARLQSLLLLEDYAGIATWLAPPELDVATLLNTSTVDVCAVVSYDDRTSTPWRVADMLKTAPPDSNRKVVFHTGDHGTPKNDTATEYRQVLFERWAERFLKGIRNGVDLEPPLRMAVTPDLLSEFFDPAHLWDVKEEVAWPPQSTVSSQYFLEANGQLRTAAPTLPTGEDTIQHRSAIDASLYALVLPDVRTLKSTYVPLVKFDYDTPALTTDMHLSGSARIVLRASSPATRYQVHASLWDVDPTGLERFVSDGFVTVRDNLPTGVNTLATDLYPQSYVFRKGHAVRLRLQNLTLHSPPSGGGAILRTLPVFTDFDLSIQRTATDASYLDLPLRPFDRPTLVTSKFRVFDNTPEDVMLSLYSESPLAGGLGIMLLGLSGSSPGFSYGGTTIPLNLDPLTSLALSNGPVISNLVGVLDGFGRTSGAALLSLLSPPLQLSGATLTAVAVVLDPLTGQVAASAPVLVPILP
jgi:hypothetical protein